MTDGNRSTIEAPERFQFDTKAGNLAQLRGRLSTARILPLETVTVSEWNADPHACLARLRRSFGDGQIIVRSSAPDEDSVESSHAGAYESVAGVDLGQDSAVAEAFSVVAGSYRDRSDGDIGDWEVLVQPMATDVRMSGVVFTRDLERNSPYLVLNYDNTTSRTDTVTAGSSDGQEILRIFKGTDPDFLAPDIGAIVIMARELETITGSDALDIEFAVSADGAVHLLQVRPLARTRIISFERIDRRIGEEIESMRSFVAERLAPRAHLLGREGILGEMPDWNPAEIIGSHPKPLAESLYRHLIMKSTWREARDAMGYRHPTPYQLLVVVGGRPYVDVRASFNSFVPASLDETIAERLVEFYLDRLRSHPELHDKIEFEIIASCLAFDFDVHEERFRAAGFEDDDVAAIESSLFALTDSVVSDADGVLARLHRLIDDLGKRRLATLDCTARPAEIPLLVEELLEDCISHGTLPFSVFARCAFIGTSFLRSLVHRSVITDDEYHRYLESIDTVASEFVADLDACKSGALSRESFLERYGHLRPGTYDITAATYAERPDLYLTMSPTSLSSPAEAQSGFNFGEATRSAVDGLLAEAGFSFDFEALNRFISTSISMREFVKFEFTKNLSRALDLIADFGRYHGLSRDDLSYLGIGDLLCLSSENLSSDHLSHLRSRIERNRNRTEVTAAIVLPDLIFSVRDIDVIALQRRKPNFTSSKRIVAEAHDLRDVAELPDGDVLRGKIVLIENADPGYDWLFGKGIAGLVTKYGGAASHMAIRCAEFGLPAAIGCGEQIFEELRRASSISLDCVERRVEAYG